MKLSALQRKTHTRNLVEFLKESARPDELITYEELSRATGLPIQDHRYILQKAREDCNREQGMVFITVNREGVRLAPRNSGPTLVQQIGLKRVKSTLKRTLRRARNAKKHTNGMSQGETLEYNRRYNHLSLLDHLTNVRFVETTSDAEPVKNHDPLAGLKQHIGV